MGGTSAGLAVMGEFIYTAQGDKPDDPNLDAKTAMADPYGARIRLAQDFLSIPITASGFSGAANVLALSISPPWATGGTARRVVLKS